MRATLRQMQVKADRERELLAERSELRSNSRHEHLLNRRQVDKCVLRRDQLRRLCVKYACTNRGLCVVWHSSTQLSADVSAESATCPTPESSR